MGSVHRGRLAGDDRVVSASLGLEMSLDTEWVAVVQVSAREDRGPGFFHLKVLLYGSPDDAVALVAGREVWADPFPNGALLPTLRRAGTFAHWLEADQLAAASFEFRQMVRDRRLSAEDHPALKAAMMHAMRRPLTRAFGFDRLHSEADQSPVNAAAFGLWAARVPQPDIF
jgi:hypothetical protein